MRPNLAKWQLDGYPAFHADRANLLLHVVAVPSFVVANVGLVASLAMRNWIGAGLCFVWMAVSFAVQGIGHKREKEPPIPFDGPVDTITRIFTEQWLTFWRFLFGGGWSRALRR